MIIMIIILGNDETNDKQTNKQKCGYRRTEKQRKMGKDNVLTSRNGIQIGDERIR